MEEPVPVPLQAASGQGSATVVAVKPTEMEVQTSSEIPNFLVTSDVYYPGWRATIDGQETKLYRADYALRGVVVPAGRHVVKFAYWPRRFYLGAAVSLLSLVLLGAVAFKSFFRQTSKSVVR